MAELELTDFDTVLGAARPQAGGGSTGAADGWFVKAMVGPVSEGQRNDTATRLAGLFLAKGFSPAYVTATLTPWARACLPAMDERELRQTVESVARRERARHGAPEPVAGAFTHPLSTLLAVADEPDTYLVSNLLIAQAAGWIGGEPKSLKSWLALYLAVCLSTGATVFGQYAVPEPVRVLYIQEEDGKRRVRRRIRRILRGLGMEPPADRFFRYAVKAGLLLDDEAWIAALWAEVESFRPGIVFLDVFERLHSKDSNHPHELKPILYTLDRLREDFGCSVVVVDHFRKLSMGTSRRGGQRLSGTVQKHAFGECNLYLFPVQKKNTVWVETELKDGPSEAFGLRLEDTEDTGVRFVWEAEKDSRAAEVKAKILEIVSGLTGSGDWASAKQVAEAAGVSLNTAKRHLDTLTDEDAKLKTRRVKVGKATRSEWQLTA